MTGFTKGPWGDKTKVVVRGLSFLSHAHYETLEGRANANLIAAAPDLYEVLEQLIDALDNEDSEIYFKKKGREALAKARGEA